MISSSRSTIVVALAVAAAGFAVAQNTEPIATVSLRFNPATLSLSDIADETAIHALLDVTNQQGLAIVLVSVRAPDGSEFALIQEPVPGWAMKATRTTIEFAGALPGGASASLPIRIVDSEAARTGQFEISIHTVEADGSLSVTRPLAPLRQDAGEYACQLVFVATVEGATSFFPVSTVGDRVPSSAHLLAAVYDPEYRSYVDPGLVEGSVRATSVGVVQASTLMPLDLSADAPFVNTAAGPMLTLPHAAAKVRATQLWGEDGPRREWFASHPGVVSLTADVSVGGEDVCLGSAYNYATSLSADASAASSATIGAGTPLLLVPPELDSDRDGFSNIAELRANSNPVWAASTPYTDDDGDSVENGRDPLTVPLPR